MNNNDNDKEPHNTKMDDLNNYCDCNPNMLMFIDF